MAIPARPQTFGMETCRDVIEKLRWEIEQLRSASPHDAESQIHICYNAAVTAWQIADWVFLDMTEDQRNKLCLRSLSDLQAYVREQCRAIYLCRHLATASKHGIVERHSDSSVNATTSAADHPIEYDDESILITPPTWSMKILDQGKPLPAIVVFELALNYWTQFVYTHRIAE